MAKENDFAQTFARLKSVLQPFASELIVKEDQPDSYVLISSRLDEKKKEIYFAGLQTKKNYVSFHFMPVYIEPDLLNEVSPMLKKRMQGKSCFNFVKIEDELLTELSDLTKTGFELFQQKEMV